MYEENENKINWMSILKRVLAVVAVILVILGIVTLVGRCTKKDSTKPGKEEPVTLTKQLDALEEAALKYLNKDNLPIELNASKTIRLKILENNGLVTDVKDDKNNACDKDESFIEVTRLENNYALKISATCGNNKDYRIVYVGCFENCEGGICKGTEDSLNGVCTEVKPSEKPAEPNNKPSSNGGTSTNNGGTSKPNGTTTKKVEYEYKKCTPNYSCTTGTLNVNKNVCETPSTKVHTDGRVDIKRDTFYSYKGSFSNTSDTKYRRGNYVSDKGYLYERTKYTCADAKYHYDDKSNACVYEESIIIESNPIANGETCETKWSTSTSLAGWTRTGKTR